MNRQCVSDNRDAQDDKLHGIWKTKYIVFMMLIILS